MKQEKKTRAKPIYISLYPGQIEIVRKYGEYTGLGNVSAALRLIINEWAREHNFNNGDKQEQETAA